MDFKEFKKQQEQLKESVSKLAQKPVNNYADERFWNITKDKVGNGSATIRFLPQQDTTKAPVVLTFRHAFQKEGRWFIEECPHTIGEKCPVCEHASAVWNTNEDEGRQHWRSKSYIANILVVADEAVPENDGKVFLFKFGKKIYDKLMDRVAPEDDDEEGVNVFHFDEGYNFKLKLGQVADFNNYDKSKFVMTASAVAGGKPKGQEAVYNAIVDLDEFLEKSRFKTYDELVAKLSGSKNATSVPSIQEELNSVKPAAEKIMEPTVTDDDDEVEDEEIDFDALLSDEDDEPKFNPDDEIPF